MGRILDPSENERLCLNRTRREEGGWLRVIGLRPTPSGGIVSLEGGAVIHASVFNLKSALSRQST